MAEAARAFDPATTLAQNQQAARTQQAAQTRGGQRGALRFPVDAPPGRPRAAGQLPGLASPASPTGGRNVVNEQMYGNRPSPEALQAQQMGHKTKLMQNKQRIREQLQNYMLFNLVRSLPQEDQQEFLPRAQEMNNQFRSLAQQFMQEKLGDPKRMFMQKQMDKFKKEARDEVEKFVQDKLIKKYGKRWAWRIIGRGSVADTPGETAWIWLFLGQCITAFQIVKGILKPDGEDFLNGPLAFLEPSAISAAQVPKELVDVLEGAATWMTDYPHALLLVFIVVGVLLTVSLLIILALAILVIPIYAGQLLGPLASLLTNIFGFGAQFGVGS
ncbi:MAG: hypothetical protein ABH826_05135 [Patescibacteria group bacterium]